MSNRSNSHNDSSETVLGWKFVIIVGVLSTIFLSFFYLAMSNEPDYMPGAQRAAEQQKQSLKNAQASSEVETQHQQHQ
jgi:hypothetical protein